MFIKKVQVQNFISYRELEMPQDLHPGCNLVLGYNGSGKSNFLQAIIFALSDAHSKKTKQERAMLLNNRSNTKEYSVEVTLDNQKQKIPVAGNDVVVKKTYNCDTDKEVYFLNGQHIQERELFNIFESGGFSLSGSSQFQIVQQGQVEQLILQGEEGFLKMLKEVTGTESFDSRVGKMNQVLTECNTKKTQLEKILDAIKGRLDELGKEIEEYREIQKIEKEKKALELALHTTKTQVNNHEIEALRRQRVALMDQRKSVIDKRDDILIENSNQKEQIDLCKNMIQLLEAKITNLNQMRNEIMNSKANNEQSANQRLVQKNLNEYFSVSYDQQIQQLNQGVQLLHKEIEQLQEQSGTIENDISKIKLKQGELIREKDLLLLKKETLENFKNPQQRKKFFQDETNKIQVQLASYSKDKEDAQKNLDLATKRVQELLQKIQAKQHDNDTLKNRIKDAEKDMLEARDDKRQVAAQLKSFMFQQNEIDLEIKALKTKYTAEVEQLERLDPIYSTLKRLRVLINEKNIAGFRGLLIDFVECDNRFAACVDLAAKSKLLSIIVDDLETAKEILALNNQIKGGVINIYPLSIIDNTQEKLRNYPQSNEVMPLSQQIKLKEGADPRLSKLIYNIFSKVALVRTYQLAMEIAKDYNLTCVTPDLQIVYAGAFITKVGQYNKAQQDRVTIYRKVVNIQSQVEQKISHQIQLEKEKDKLSGNDLDAMRKIQKAEITMNNLKSQSQQNNTLLFDLQVQQEQKENSVREYKKVIENLSYQEASAQEQLKDLEKQSQSKGESFSDQDQNRLLFLNKTLDELNRQLFARENERTQFTNQLSQAKKMLNDNYLKRKNDIQQNILEQQIESNIMDKKDEDLNKHVDDKEFERIEKELQIYNQQLKKKQDELQNLMSQIEVQGDNEGLMSELRAKTIEIEEISMKIDEVQGRNFQLESLIKKIESYDKQTFDNAMRDFDLQQVVKEINLRGQELEKFPRMNRHCVEWYDKYTSKHEDLQKKFKDQIETEQGLLRLLVDLDAQKQQALEKNFMKLNQNFQEIFAKIVSCGVAEMRLIKSDQEDDSQISHPSQFQEGSQVMKIGQQVYKGIKVRVSFSGQNNQLEGLGHLSGGQKAVVAASLLFAIFKIEPAPFYIMDEFDNALDAEFRGAIAGLIYELSAQSQFLITTFKPELVDGADRLYQVLTKNNKSEIIEIDQKKAYEIMNDNNK